MTVIRACSGQLRVGGMGGHVVGIDMGAAFGVAKSLGADLQAMAVLLPCGESGLVKAFNERMKQDG